MIRAGIKRTGNTEILSILAQRYLSEQDSLKQAGLLRIFGKGCPFPLPYLYEHTLCSFCREYIVREMGRRYMITKTFLQEYLHDSNCEVRKYAGKRIKN